MDVSSPDPAALRVLARPAFANREKNPYNWLLYSGLASRGVSVDEFSARNLALRRYDVMHVHWPESTFNSSLPEAIATTRSLLLSLDVLRARGTRIVWTAHNLRAHERRFPRVEENFWRAFVPRLDAVFALSESGLNAVRERFPLLAERPGFVVPHHHYRGEYPDGATRSQARVRLGLPQDAEVVLFFGRILEYKNVPALIEAFRRLPPSRNGRRSVLAVAGKPNDRALDRAVRCAAAGDERVSLHLRFVPRDEAQFFFRAADLVVLPYREILNSGSAVLALGFDRPVLMPELGAGLELQKQAGKRWVQLYAELGPEALADALARASRLPPATDGSQLAALNPERAVAGTLAGYHATLRTRLASTIRRREPAFPRAGRSA